MEVKREQIVYVDNKPHIKAKVVLLPNKNGVIFKRNSTGLHLYTSDTVNDSTLERFHIYITSDEEIKGGDWFIDLNSKHILKASINFGYDPKDFAKKIIATTDEMLIYKDGDDKILKRCQLPQPSQQFIEKYIDEYNKGNQITDVLVEVKDYIYNPETDSQYKSSDRIYIEDCEKRYKLKLDSHNFITIRKQNDSWSREEVRQLCYQAFIHHKSINGKIKPADAINLIEPFQKWVEENL